jgi:hypothetical protein
VSISTPQIREMRSNSDFMALGTPIDWRILQFGFADIGVGTWSAKHVESVTRVDGDIVLHGILFFNPYFAERAKVETDRSEIGQTYRTDCG